ncbi:hypothetical protein BDF19DRAFT_241391 [Syncephalis fuscata]|nr:hypothetical protein BDF19DRAFT_241391 [Syncephalis fuscata]
MADMTDQSEPQQAPPLTYDMDSIAVAGEESCILSKDMPLNGSTNGIDSEVTMIKSSDLSNHHENNTIAVEQETGPIRRSKRARKLTAQYVEAVKSLDTSIHHQQTENDVINSINDNSKVIDATTEQVEDIEEEEHEHEEDIEDDKLYCLCRKPDDGTVMISCDGCSEWYHAKCVGLTKGKVAKITTYYCPINKIVLNQQL